MSRVATYPGRNTQGFASLLDRILLREKGNASVAEVAHAIDVSPSTLYDYCNGRLTIPPDLIPDLYRACHHDRRLLDFFLSELNVSWFELPECTEPAMQGLLHQCIRAQEEFLDVLRTTSGAMADGQVTPKELRKIRDEFWEAIGELSKLLACAEADARRDRTGRGV